MHVSPIITATQPWRRPMAMIIMLLQPLIRRKIKQQQIDGSFDGSVTVIQSVIPFVHMGRTHLIKNPLHHLLDSYMVCTLHTAFIFGHLFHLFTLFVWSGRPFNLLAYFSKTRARHSMTDETVKLTSDCGDPMQSEPVARLPLIMRTIIWTIDFQRLKSKVLVDQRLRGADCATDCVKWCRSFWCPLIMVCIRCVPAKKSSTERHACSFKWTSLPIWFYRCAFNAILAAYRCYYHSPMATEEISYTSIFITRIYIFGMLPLCKQYFTVFLPTQIRKCVNGMCSVFTKKKQNKCVFVWFLLWSFHVCRVWVCDGCAAWHGSRNNFGGLCD